MPWAAPKPPAADPRPPQEQPTANTTFGKNKLKQTFTTARALAFGVELVGVAIVTLALVLTALTLYIGDTATGISALMVVAAGAATAGTGLGLILFAQLVQAQVATAINTSQILDHVVKLTPRPATPPITPPISAQRHPQKDNK